jgi:ABC-2 type transport system permease protein
MKPFAAFVKMQLNVNYGISALKYRFTREKKKRWEPILIAAVIIISFAPLLVLYTAMMLSLFAAGMAIGQPDMILTLSIMFSQSIILFFGLFYVMGTFYFSNDLESFVPLPLKPYEVIGGKIIVVMINEYLTSMPIMLPPIIIYGAGTGQGIIYWIKSLLLILTVPIIPLTAASLFVMLLMRLVNFRRYKDVLTIAGGIIGIILSIGLSTYMQRMPDDAEEMQNFFIGQTGLADMLGEKFPPIRWATVGLTDGGLAGVGYLLLFLLVCALFLVLLMILSNRVFYKSLLAGNEVSRKKKDLTDIQKQKLFAKASDPVIAMMRRDWKLLVRTPIYLLNGFVGTIFGPLIFVFIMVMQRNEPEFAQLFNEIGKAEILPYVMLGGLGLMLFTAGMNMVASTALSREGKTLWITKMIPVTGRQQANAKLLVSLIVSSLGVIVTALILLVLFKLPILWVIAAAVVGLLGSVPMNALSLVVDIFHPKLVWSSEQEAMKQNMNGAIGMLLSIFVLVILGFVAFLMMALELPMSIVFLAIGAVSVILGVLSLILLYKIAEKKYSDLEA